MKSVICVSYCKPGLGDPLTPLTLGSSKAVTKKIQFDYTAMFAQMHRRAA
jgi:hypothetical protein